MTNKERKLKMLCEKFISSPPKYRMRIVLPQIIESINELKIEKNIMLNEEGILDKIGSWFTGGGTGANTLWETMIEYILDGMGIEDGLLRDAFTVVLANAKWTELPGIFTNCHKLTDLVIAEMPEIAAKYISKQFVDENVFTTFLRKWIIDSLSDTSFGEGIKSTVDKIVCDSLGWVGQLFAEPMKQEKEKPYGSYNTKPPKKFEYK